MNSGTFWEPLGIFAKTDFNNRGCFLKRRLILSRCSTRRRCRRSDLASKISPTKGPVKSGLRMKLDVASCYHVKKEFLVSVLDRESLEAFIGEELVGKLTDEEMQGIADDLIARLVDAGYWEQELRELLEDRDETVILESY